MSKLEGQWVDQYFSNGIDIVNRRVFINDLDEESVSRVIKGIFLMETIDPETPVDLFINSAGGEVYETLSLYDTMLIVSMDVHTFGSGKVMSAAPLLLAAGTPGQRWVSASTFFMYHSATDEVRGNPKQLKSDVQHFSHLDDTWMTLLSQHTKKDLKFWKSMANKGVDVYFDAAKAIEFGICDKIWTGME